MREYNRRSGSKIILTSIIYDSVEEFKSYYPEIELKKWSDILIQKDDWVIADDGYIVQCLSSKMYQTVRHILYYFRFPMGTFCITSSKGKHYIPAFYAQFSKPKLSGIGTSNGKEVNQKIRFATLVILGFDFGQAYKMCYPNGVLGSETSFKKGLKLMNDNIVKVELKNQLQSFTNKLKDNFTEERLIDELEQLLSKSRKGSMAHRQNLELILQLTGYMDNPLSKKKQAEEVNYEEIIPPQLPQ